MPGVCANVVRVTFLSAHLQLVALVALPKTHLSVSVSVRMSLIVNRNQFVLSLSASEGGSWSYVSGTWRGSFIQFASCLPKQQCFSTGKFKTFVLGQRMSASETRSHEIVGPWWASAQASSDWGTQQDRWDAFGPVCSTKAFQDGHSLVWKYCRTHYRTMASSRGALWCGIIYRGRYQNGIVRYVLFAV